MSPSIRICSSTRVAVAPQRHLGRLRRTACVKNIHTTGENGPVGSITPRQLPSETTNLAPQCDLFCDRVRFVSMKRPLVFTALATATGFVVAAVATNYETAKWQKRVVYDPNGMVVDELSWMGMSYSLQMYNEWRRDTTMRAIDFGRKLRKGLDYLSPETKRILGEAYIQISDWWVGLLEGQQICRELALGLVAIHLLRYTPFAKSFATRYFTHDVWSGRTLTLFTSQLGHSGWLHLTSNIVKLLGVGELTWFTLRHQQVKEGERLHEALSGYHFLAFYLAAGTVGSLASHAFVTRWQSQKLGRVLLCPRIGAPVIPPHGPSTSGASAAISANMAFFALEWWDPHPALLFFPSTEMTMGPLLLGFMVVDLIGLRRGWRKIDPAAHVGGVAFGTAYYFLGPTAWDLLRRMTDWRTV